MFRRGLEVSGIAVSGRDVFVCCPSRTGFAVYRTDQDFANPTRIVDRLRGCCGQMDIQSWSGELYVAENSRHRVVRYDRDGHLLSSWGERDRPGLNGFGGCCNPMNLRFARNGDLLTAEAGLGRIKRYTPDGKLLALVGAVDLEAGCKHVAIDISADGRRVFVLDISRGDIAVLARPQTMSVRHDAGSEPRGDVR